MTEPIKRDRRGRWLPGQSANSTAQWGPENPPPKSPGRPKRDAWLNELIERLEDPQLRQALASKLLRIALGGSERTSLRAIDLIQDRVGGPVVRQIAADVGVNSGVLVVPATMSPAEWIAAASAHNAEAKEPGTEDEEETE